MEAIAGLLEKTAAGRQEIAARTGSLDSRHRALLIMFDGRTKTDTLLERARLLGLEADAVLRLLGVGFIQHVAAPGDSTPVEKTVESQSHADDPKRATENRSLVTAKMYLIDMMARTLLGTTDNSIRTRLIRAADLVTVEQVFEEFLFVLGGTAKPTMVAHIEKSFRGLLPICEANSSAEP